MNDLGKIIMSAIPLALAGCSVELQKTEYISYYEEQCRTSVSRNGMVFSAMPLTADYETVKWGAPLDSGMRVVFWIEPYSGASFDTAFLVDGNDTSALASFRQIESFELKTVDSFVLGFAEKHDKAKLIVKNVGNGIGNVEFKIKNCQNIRLARD